VDAIREREGGQNKKKVKGGILYKSKTHQRGCSKEDFRGDDMPRGAEIMEFLTKLKMNRYGGRENLQGYLTIKPGCKQYPARKISERERATNWTCQRV